MLEIDSIFKSGFQNRVIREGYNFSDGTYGIPDNDSDVAIIREFLQGNIADVRLSAQNTYAAASTVQMSVDAAATIHDKLILMEQLAHKAANGYYTSIDKTSMQKKFEQSAKDINKIVDNTKYENNKLFTANGQVITLPLGNGQTVHLFARGPACGRRGGPGGLCGHPQAVLLHRGLRGEDPGPQHLSFPLDQQPRHAALQVVQHGGRPAF